MTTAIAKKDIDRPVKELEAIARRFADTTLAQAERSFSESVVIAAAIQQMKDNLTPDVMRAIRPLAGTKVGFLVDKNYDDETLKNVIIEATLNGAYLAGNEFNIISGQCYLTKGYFTRRLREFPGFSDLHLDFDVPRIQGESAICRVRASFNLDKKPNVIEREIPIRLNKGQGPDAAIGKAERKIKAAIWSFLTGSDHLSEVDSDEIIPPEKDNGGPSQLTIEG